MHMLICAIEILNIIIIVVSSMSRSTMSAILDSKSSTFSRGLLISLLMASGNVELNPGTSYKHPSGICLKSVKSNQRGVQCDFCDIWYHVKCMQMSTFIYDALATSSCIWEFSSCGLPFSQALYLSPPMPSPFQIIFQH